MHRVKIMINKAIVIKFIVSQAIPHEILAPHAFFIIVIT